MKVLSTVILAGLVYGFVHVMRWFFNELAEFVAEAWHNGEAEHEQ